MSLYAKFRCEHAVFIMYTPYSMYGRKVKVRLLFANVILHILEYKTPHDVCVVMYAKK